MATVEARTADGRVVGRADALCTRSEKRGPWKSADDYARLSMAQTRATAKALKGPLGFVISLAGYQTTPAEEMTFAEPETHAVPAVNTTAAENGNAEGEPEDAAGGPDTAATIDAERAEQIVAALHGLKFKEINLLLGAAGADAVRAFSAKALGERIESLSDEQADALLAELKGDGDGDA